MRLTLHTDFALRVLIQVGLNDGNDNQRHRADFRYLEGALDEGRQRSQSKGLSRNSARP